MRNLSVATLLLIAPSLAAAQTSVNGSAETKANADVRAGHTDANAEASASAVATANRPRMQQDSTRQHHSRANALQSLSVESRARAEATFERAQQDSVPEQPLVSAMLEAKAKGAAESQILTAQQRALARLKASKEALVHGSHSQPSDEEMSRGANVLARGATEAQLEGLVRRCPSDRSLTVAFETLTELTARGIPVSTAVSEVGARLQAGASDDAIRSLNTTLTANAATNARLNPTGVDAGASTAASASAAAGQAVGGASATGGLTGAITGATRR